MDMSLFDQTEDLKASRGKRDHRNKNNFNSEDTSDLRRKANRRDKPRQRSFDLDGDDE
jgi:hypothetical protein